MIGKYIRTPEIRKALSEKRVISSPYKKFHNKELLEKMYWDEDLSFSEMAKKIDCPIGRVQKLMNKFQIPRRKAAPRSGSKNPNWNGGRYTSPSGYVYILTDRVHPRSFRKGPSSFYVPEHYLVMEKSLGRFLRKNETIHHRNGIKTDNNVDNLQLLTCQKEHQELEQKILLFAKQLLWGDLQPELKPKLQELFNGFLKEK